MGNNVAYAERLRHCQIKMLEESTSFDAMFFQHGFDEGLNVKAVDAWNVNPHACFISLSVL